MLSLTIDGREVGVPEGTTVIQAAEQLGIFIPRYCYHPGLSIAGNCRICLVDVEKSPKLQIACNMPVTDGMVVHTKNDRPRPAGARCWNSSWPITRSTARCATSPVSATYRTTT